jgi:hypothetical protein
MNCELEQGWLAQLLKLKPKVKHVWKVHKEENLGKYMYFGGCANDITTMYRIGVHKKCIRCGTETITERSDLFPVE